MAKHRRKRSRINSGRGRMDRERKQSIEARGEEWAWYKSTPLFWRKLHFTRPARRREKRLMIEALKGADHDNVAWPIPKKPHSYYW